MEEVKEEYKVIMNPYVTQAERFAVSLHHLGEKFLKIEEPKEQFSEEEISVMCELVVDKVCKSCENRGMCMKGEKEHIHQMIREILCTVEIYGIDLNMEMKKRLQKECILAPRFLRETLETFQNAKREMLWQNKMILGWDGDFLSNVLLAIIVIASVGEIITTAYKTARYGTDR